jgi:hypothetical protein
MIVQFLLHVTLSGVGLALWGWWGLIAGLTVSMFLAAWYFIARVERWLAVTRPSIETARAVAAPLAAALLAGGVALVVVAVTRHGTAGRGHGIVTLALAGGALLPTYLAVLAWLSPPIWRRARGLWSVQ